MSSQASLGDKDDSCWYFSPEWRAIVDFLLILLNRKPTMTSILDLQDPGHIITCKNRGARAFLVRRNIMTQIRWIPGILVLVIIGLCVTVAQDSTAQRVIQKPYPNFELEVLVNGRPVAEYYARGGTYIEAIQGAEYELRVRNPSSDRVAVALSVDGLNTIDARHTSAWNASKWV